MIRILVCFVLIFTIRNAVMADFSLSITDMDSVMEWRNKLYKRNDYYLNNTVENVKKVQNRVESLSLELNELNNQIKSNLASMLTPFFTCSNLTEYHHSLISQSSLLYNFNRINRTFGDSLEYIFSGIYSNDTLKYFGDSVLFGDENVGGRMREIRHILIPRLHNRTSPLLTMDIAGTESSIENVDSAKSVTAQQQIYYIYAHLIVTEMKCLAVLKHIYMYKWSISEESYSYMAELEFAKTEFSKWVKQYNKIFIKSLNILSRQFRPCHVNSPIAGIHYIEAKRFSRAMIFQPSQFSTVTCTQCPPATSIDELSQRLHIKIYNCQIFGGSAGLCSANSNSSRDYLWWQDANGKIYGHNSTCSNVKAVSGGVPHPTIIVPVTVILSHCSLFVCSVDQDKMNENNKLITMRISVTEQISDIWNKKIVTGVKFAMHGNSIHLQIQEATLALDGLTHNETIWKPLNYRYDSHGKIQKNIRMSYVGLTHKRKSFSFDQVYVPAFHAVTGVKLTLIDDSIFTLNVHATLFNMKTGKLEPSSSSWSSVSGMIPQYEEELHSGRTEINLSNADDPLRGSGFTYNEEPNKIIQFTHTNLEKDAGQTTIPFFDAQPVAVTPPFPLSGIGLSYRGSDGYGGYIVPTLYTIDIKKYMFSRINFETNDEELD